MQIERGAEPVICEKPLRLWPFAVQLYQAPGMERICLALQDSHAINVNLVLWCAWMDYQQLPLEAALIPRARRDIALWHYGVVEPLRYLRRGLPKIAVVNRFRAGVGALELMAEKRVLRRLERLTRETLGTSNAPEVAPGERYLRLLLSEVPPAIAVNVIDTVAGFSPDQRGLG